MRKEKGYLNKLNLVMVQVSSETCKVEQALLTCREDPQAGLAERLAVFHPRNR